MKTNIQQRINRLKAQLKLQQELLKNYYILKNIKYDRTHRAPWFAMHKSTRLLRDRLTNLENKYQS